MNRFFPGQVVEIKPAYEMDTGSRTGWDNTAGCEAEIVRECRASNDVEVYIRGIGEVFVNAARIKAR